MTGDEHSDIIMKQEIEVACFKSKVPDVAGTEDGMGKGNAPKEEKSCDLILGHAANNRMTVI